jgi:hypothetical protein
MTVIAGQWHVRETVAGIIQLGGFVALHPLLDRPEPFLGPIPFCRRFFFGVTLSAIGLVVMLA